MIQNGIEYERRGEQYYPLLDLGEQTTYEIGKYGKLHLAFIKRHRVSVAYLETSKHRTIKS